MLNTKGTAHAFADISVVVVLARGSLERLAEFPGQRVACVLKMKLLRHLLPKHHSGTARSAIVIVSR